ncbi:hypothetical protein NR996_07335 [Lactobacillus rodentium]|uniref:ABC transporter permease protein n=1 Tax=Lactobacillus rodentium TaxID=947835 RepID=A0A2Z6T7X2_9LACO|nr:hypothetical protein [Lactobacillus rodentium]MCR1895198.1 hypothetical protein [Lactobacillus rodentium]GBG05516.1 ABC transporter permease protein [Lactobacillus rodentium]
MLSTGEFFKYTFKLKNKSVNFLLLLQFIVAIIGACWLAIYNSKLTLLDKWSMGIVMVEITSIFAIIIYLFISTVSNEKINSSKTWQLLPISSKNFYLVNLFSSVLNAIYLVFMQVIMALIVLIPLTAFKEFRKGVGLTYSLILKRMDLILKDVLPISILIVVFMLLFLIALYLFVTTVNFVSTLLVEQLSKNNSKLARFLLIVVIVVITLIIGINMIDLAASINFFSSNTWLQWVRLDGVMIFIDLIFLFLNIWLLKNYHEGR